ncbi:hypothetical protein OIE66_40510 [Nonomuraea sp. NBC_01738]|uniref:hypothetical protein n=1 Tax=Nonomuraea sp. NBC_01738 TaxID=2976003 RepID=UPI002E130D35|nr:hypothetical protein OIE66_40510 [Nonomuraea sp. NBC_01738]
MSWRYVGETPAAYPAYLDKATGSTLVAEPGGVYDMEPADGTDYTVEPLAEGEEPTARRLPVPPPGPWQRAKTTSPSSSDKSKE